MSKPDENDYIMREGELNRLAGLVEREVYKKILWVTKHILREEFSHEDMMHNIRVSVFQAWAEDPESSDEKILRQAIKECKGWYTGPSTACYDRVKRNRPSKTRTRLFNSDVRDFNISTESPNFQNPRMISEEDPLQVGLNAVYQLIAEACGHEIAVLYVLKEGYNFSTTRIVENILGISQDSDDFNAQRKRVDRLKNIVRNVLKEKLYVSRESRKLLNV